MTIQIHIGAVQVPVKQINFSDGGSNFTFDWPAVPPPLGSSINVCVLPETDVDCYLQEITSVLYFIRSAPRVSTGCVINLVLPYLPHGRADRQFDRTHTHPLFAFFEALKGLGIDRVTLFDPHSDVVLSEFAEDFKFHVVTQRECFLGANVPVSENTLLIAPDMGAANKVALLAEGYKLPTLNCAKKRDLSNGRVIATILPGESAETSTNSSSDFVAGKRCLIVDDIADGGGTFIPLAEKLRHYGAESVDLYVTHGIFAKGLDIFRQYLDKIYVYQVVGNYVSRSDIQKFNDTWHSRND